MTTLVTAEVFDVLHKNHRIFLSTLITKANADSDQLQTRQLHNLKVQNAPSLSTGKGNWIQLTSLLNITLQLT